MNAITQKILTTLVVSSALFSACSQQLSDNNTDITATGSTVASTGDNVSQSLTDDEGNKLDMNFDNINGVVTIDFNGETAELTSNKPASGIWYKNDQYELRGKGNDITLSKSGNVVFEHEDDIVSVQSKSDNGDVLDMTFNNTEGTVKAYLNGGNQIDLVQERAASGIWYKNEQFELRGKGSDYSLTKDGTTVFEN